MTGETCCCCQYSTLFSIMLDLYCYDFCTSKTPYTNSILLDLAQSVAGLHYGEVPVVGLHYQI